MTPQLQQAIGLLQYSNMELSSWIDEQIVGNPLLSRETGPNERELSENYLKSNDEVKPPDNIRDTPALTVSNFDVPKHALSPDSPTHLNEYRGTITSAVNHIDNEYDFTSNVEAKKTLSDVLMEQLFLDCSDPETRQIGQEIIGHTDDAGYLQTSTQELSLKLGLKNDAVESVLTKLQTFEPAGVFARSLTSGSSHSD